MMSEQKCVYCEDIDDNENDGGVFYECDDCGTLYCDDCGAHNCPNCGAPLSHAHTVEKMGSTWNPHRGF